MDLNWIQNPSPMMEFHGRIPSLMMEFYLHGLLWDLKIHSFTRYPLNAYSMLGTVQGTEIRWKGPWPTHQHFDCSWGDRQINRITIQHGCSSRGNMGYFGEHIQWVFNSALGHQEIFLLVIPELLLQVEGVLCIKSRASSVCVSCWEIWALILRSLKLRG